MDQSSEIMRYNVPILFIHVLDTLNYQKFQFCLSMYLTLSIININRGSYFLNWVNSFHGPPFWASTQDNGASIELFLYDASPSVLLSTENTDFSHRVLTFATSAEEQDMFWHCNVAIHISFWSYNGSLKIIHVLITEISSVMYQFSGIIRYKVPILFIHVLSIINQQSFLFLELWVYTFDGLPFWALTRDNGTSIEPFLYDASPSVLLSAENTDFNHRDKLIRNGV